MDYLMHHHSGSGLEAREPRGAGNEPKRERPRADGCRQSRHGKNVAGIQRKIASYLHTGAPVPPALAKNLADLLWKEQRSRLGQLQNMRRRGELR
jgi:hypothetical protein